MNLKYRQDNRTINQFTKDIANRTKKERFLVDLFKCECEYRGHTVIIKDNGVDNSGQIVSQATCAADFEITIDGIAALYDVKCSPVSTRCTFKRHSLKQYVAQQGNILLFYGVGRIDNDLNQFDYNNARYGVISTNNIVKLLELPVYIEPLFGNKPCIKILANVFDNYFKSYKLMHVG